MFVILCYDRLSYLVFIIYCIVLSTNAYGTFTGYLRHEEGIKWHLCQHLRWTFPHKSPPLLYFILYFMAHCSNRYRSHPSWTNPYSSTLVISLSFLPFRSSNAVQGRTLHTNPQPPKARLSFTNPQMSDMSDDDEPRFEQGKALHMNTQQPKDTSSHTNPQTSDTSDDDEPRVVETPSGSSHILVQVNKSIPNQTQTRFFFSMLYTCIQSCLQYPITLPLTILGNCVGTVLVLIPHKY